MLGLKESNTEFRMYKSEINSNVLLGRLFEKDGILHFEGDVDQSADQFMATVLYKYNGMKQELEKCYGEIADKEAIIAELGRKKSSVYTCKSCGLTNPI